MGGDLTMSDKKFAYCGIDCMKCPAYIATVTDDDELRAKTAEKWSTADLTINASDINCLGCTDDDSGLSSWCPECSVRKCAREREMETCAHCDDYMCEKLGVCQKRIGDSGSENLKAIRKNLN